MPTKVERKTADLSGYPTGGDLSGDAREPDGGLKTLLGFRPKIWQSVAEQPAGLLSHENFNFSLFPMHLAFRQYGRDMDWLLPWSRSQPHRQWVAGVPVSMQEARVSGTRRISGAAGWKRCTTIFRSR